MKKFYALSHIILFTLIICLVVVGVVPQQLKAELQLETRLVSIENAVNRHNPEKSLLFGAYRGLSIEKIRSAYRESGPRTDAWLKEEGVSYSPFVESLLRVVMLFKMTADSPEKAMSILAPIFGLVFLINVIPFTFKALFIPPDMENPQKPENDTIIRRWFGRRKKTEEKPDNEAKDDDLSNSDGEDDEETGEEDKKEDGEIEEDES